MDTAGTYSQETDYDAFVKDLPSLLQSHGGKVAVFHEAALVRICDTMIEAVKFGTAEYGDERFIAQDIVDEEPSALSHSLAI